MIAKHPILKGRVLDVGDNPLLVCDSYPSIELIVDDIDYSTLIIPFELDKSLARFFIICNGENRFIFYDLHHIISDATNDLIIDREFDSIFKGIFDNNIDFGFVYASCDSFESKFKPEYDVACKFFRNMFADVDDVQYLLDDICGSKGTVSLPIRGIRSRIDSFASEMGLTVGSLLNAVFAYTYSRFTGSDKVYYTFSEHGRHEEYSQDALGMFVRTIPLIVDCKNTSVNEYLTGVSDLILDSMVNSVYPFRLLAHEFNIDNSVSFEYNYDLNKNLSIGDDIAFSDDAYEVSDFYCVVNDLEDGFLVNLSHCEKYSQATIARFANAFKEILIQILSKKDLSDISYISSEDLELLDSFNSTEHSLVYDDILDAFTDNIKKYPDNPLVLDDDIPYSYLEGTYLINEIKHLLAKHDIGVKDKVSVFVDRGNWVLLANMAVLAQGATYVPIDEKHPDGRIGYMIEKSESKAIIVTDTFQDRVYGLLEDLDIDPIVINVSSLSGSIGDLASLDYVDPGLNDVACILFTSGTTGDPKAVQVGRRSIVNMVQFYADNSNFTSDDVYGVFASVGFDVSLQHYAALLCGGAVTWVPNDVRLNIEKLNEYFIRHGVTHTIMTTQISKLFIENIVGTSIKSLCAVGEKLGDVVPPENYDFLDVYGPTEATSSMTSIKVADKIDPSSVGSPDWNTKIYVLDNEKRRVPVGASGELYISGYQVSRGYLNNVDANGKAFFDNLFDGDLEGYERMYKTGDLVRILPDGTIGFIGRNDSQVKIRGNRVELSEIEVALRDLDYIDDVTVQTVEINGNNDLVAYLVSSIDDIDLKDYVCDYLRENKPEYMVPSFVVTLDRIPLNVNGKVDKRALPDIDLDDLHTPYMPPTNKTEREIVKAFEKAFNQDKLGIYDDFVRLGGDSLTAIKIKSFLSLDIDARDILKARTPYKIAKIIGVDKREYGFDLVKEGTGNQNMFILPPLGGMSFALLNLVNNIDFEGNIYLIDDFKYDLSIDEIRSIEGNDLLTLNYYYDSIKDLFQDEDIIVAYSAGCVYAALLAEKLEKTKYVDKCILLDGTLEFTNNGDLSKEDIEDRIIPEELDIEFNNDYFSDIKEKFIEVHYINSKWDFHTPQINSHIIYLATSYESKDDLDNISDNYEFIHIDSTHLDIVGKDVDKISKYFR